ncbi:MAG: hypothetical protein IKL51_07525 [Lachnospiraceae bacterium]|nr:hypothetical protein [Lachnospiraceae bacterium]
MNDILANAVSGITGNIAKAVIFVRDVKPGEKATVAEGTSKAEELQKKLLERTKQALSSTSYSSITGKKGMMTNSGFLALEVQFNPNNIQMETVAGVEVEYEGGNLGSRSANQIVQIKHPASTTMNFELIFDDVNPADAFMLENLAPALGNLTSNAASAVKKIKEQDYGVQSIIDGFMSLLTRDITRQIIFFWGKTCFAGELIGVSSRYTMFNKKGRPIRGVVQLSIRQGEDAQYTQGKDYWSDAFNKAFGEVGLNGAVGKASVFEKVTNNNFLNLNL